MGPESWNERRNKRKPEKEGIKKKKLNIAVILRYFSFN